VRHGRIEDDAGEEMRRTATAMLAVLVLGVAACGNAGLPGDARDALESYWGSLPSDTGIEYRVTRAWQGERVGGLPSGELAPTDVWCVETETAADDPSLDGSRLVWIVSREDAETQWTPALLVTLSANWPYEACVPGSPDS
jgi:hypothetical protein